MIPMSCHTALARKLFAFALFTGVALAGLTLAAPSALAQQGALRVLSSNGMKAVIEEIRPQLEKAAGQPLAIEFGTSATIRERIEKGESFDAVVLTVEVIDALAKAGKVAPGSVNALGRTAVGVGVRAGAAKPDIGTPDAIKKALLATKSPTYVGAGAARAPVDRMLAALGIADAVASKVVVARSVDEALESVAAGHADMILAPTSEILPAAGVQLVGPLPGEFTSYISFAGAVSPTTSAASAAQRFVAELRRPGAASSYRAKGMELSQ
jgi:molybdate transport system substrate-binding protein